MPSFKDCLDGAKVLAGIAAATTAVGPIGAATAALTASGAAHDLSARLARKPGLTDRVARAMTDAIDAQNLTADTRALVIQMTEVVTVSPAQVMAAARDPTRIADAMLTTLTSRDHSATVVREAFRRTMEAVLTGLLADSDVLEELRPAFENFFSSSISLVISELDEIKAIA